MPESADRTPNRRDQLLGVDEAQARILSAFAPLSVVEIPLLECDGLVLGEDIVAEIDLPPFTNSAMDGYAVRAIDTLGATRDSPISLALAGTAPAGAQEEIKVSSGTAVRVMTGAPLPKGADAVVRFEETDQGANGKTCSNLRVQFFRAPAAGDHVRPQGEDVPTGSVVLRMGHTLRPPEIGLLAALNRAFVPVIRRPRVAILSTGDEIAQLGVELAPGQIRNSNAYLLSAMTKRFGGEPIMLGVARDNIADLTSKLDGAASFDLILTSGGVSLGDFDIVKDVLVGEGGIALWQIAIKPGKPLAFGHIGNTPLIGLPGNPAAAAVCYEQFGRPAIKRMLGRTDLNAPVIQAILTERVENQGHRRHFIRAVVDSDLAGGYRVRVAGSQGSGVMTSLVRSNGLLVIPEELEVAEPGMTVSVQMIDWTAYFPIAGEGQE